MGWPSRAFTRRNIVAIGAGILLASAPLVTSHFWLGGVINRQGQEEVDTSAKRAISLAEFRVNDAVGALNQLAAQGVELLHAAYIDAMRLESSAPRR